MTNNLHTPRKIPANGDMAGSPYDCERSSGVFYFIEVLLWLA